MLASSQRVEWSTIRSTFFPASTDEPSTMRLLDEVSVGRAPEDHTTSLAGSPRNRVHVSGVQVPEESFWREVSGSLPPRATRHGVCAAGAPRSVRRAAMSSACAAKSSGL
jgi:hypothetical protein